MTVACSNCQKKSSLNRLMSLYGVENGKNDVFEYVRNRKWERKKVCTGWQLYVFQACGKWWKEAVNFGCVKWNKCSWQHTSRYIERISERERENGDKKKLINITRSMWRWPNKYKYYSCKIVHRASSAFVPLVSIIRLFVTSVVYTEYIDR